MKTRLEEIEELILENCTYMDWVYDIIKLNKSTFTADDFISKLKNRISLEIEKNNILKNNY